MSRDVNRLHPITLVIHFFSSLKNFVLPFAFISIGKGGLHYSFNPDSSYFTKTLIYMAVLLFSIFVLFLFSFIKWKRFVYWFEDGELRIEYGLFVKKKRYIPFERIQSLNYKEGIFHRPFKLVKVSVETAGDKDGKAEADLVAITRKQANMIEIEMEKAKGQLIQKDLDMDIMNEQNNIHLKERERSIIHRMSTKDLVILATTSSGLGVVISGLLAITSQFNDWIPYEQIYGEFQAFIKFSVLVIVIVSFIVLLISWLVSVAITFLNHFGFVIEKEEDKLFISKGLLEKKRVTISMKRIQGIRIVENPIRQLFGYATIVIESAGSSGEKGERKIVLLPLVKKQQGLAILKNLFPEEQWDLPLQPAPKKALPRYMVRHLYWLTPIAVVISYFTYPYGLLSFLLLPLAMLIGIWQHHSAGFAIKNQQLIIVYRGISRTTFVTLKRRIQVMSLSQSYFAKRKDLATLTVHIMSGSLEGIAEVKHFELAKMEDIYKWYNPIPIQNEMPK